LGLQGSLYQPRPQGIQDVLDIIDDHPDSVSLTFTAETDETWTVEVELPAFGVVRIDLYPQPRPYVPWSKEWTGPEPWNRQRADAQLFREVIRTVPGEDLTEIEDLLRGFRSRGESPPWPVPPSVALERLLAEVEVQFPEQRAVVALASRGLDEADPPDQLQTMLDIVDFLGLSWETLVDQMLRS